MLPITWLRKLVYGTSRQTTRRAGRLPRSPWNRARLFLEGLEDRLAPATFNVTTTNDTHAVNLTTGDDGTGYGGRESTPGPALGAAVGKNIPPPARFCMLRP